MYLPPVKADLDLSGTSPASSTDETETTQKFKERALAVTEHNVNEPLLDPLDCHGDIDYGQNYHRRLFARFEYSILHANDPDPTIQANKAKYLKEAIDSLNAMTRDQSGEMGTTSEHDCIEGGLSTDPKELLGFFTDFTVKTGERIFSNADRKGEYDTLMNPLITILYRYGKRGPQHGGANLLPPDTYSHVLSLIDLKPGIGGVESITFGADPITGTLFCGVACGGNPFCFALCEVEVLTAKARVPETENHINNTYVAQYLANQLWFDETGDPKYENARNGYRVALLNRMKEFLRNDFVEYNSHNYQDYTMTAIFNLASYADDSAVNSAAKNVLNYVSAKVAVSSNDARRSTPFRRLNEDDHTCGELLLQKCHDPQTAFYMMLTGATDILTKVPDILPNEKPDPVDPTKKIPVRFAPPTYEYEFQWAAASNYRVNHPVSDDTIDNTILDLFVNREHRNFYQFFHYTNTGSNDELYFGSPSYLLSAGGHPTQYSSTADLPFPFSLIFGKHPGREADLGIAVHTTLMPTGDLHSRDQMIRFSDPSGENMCVAPNFACGLKPEIPQAYLDIGVPDGPWTFIDKSNPTANPAYGYYVAIYRQDGFGFLEVYDTFSHPDGVMTFAEFKQKVLDNNDPVITGRTYSQNSDNNFYKTIHGDKIQFNPDAKIISINDKPPYDPNRTNGTIINNDGTGLITIKNPALGTQLTLNGRVPPDHSLITVPGPLDFGDTCVGSKSVKTLNVCNDGNGTENLFVYNILSLDTRFKVTEPSSGYPVTIGSNFCFPFQSQFAPTSVGPATSIFKISNSDPGQPYLDVEVSGKGIQQSIATVIANNGSFGDVCLESFKDLDLTISNSGGCTLSVTGISSSSAEFQTAGTLSFPLKIAPGSSLQVPIRFKPTSLGGKTANIAVSSNDPTTPDKVVAVSGNTPPGDIRVTGSTDFGDVCANLQTPAEKTISVANVGACNLKVTSVAFDPACSDFTLINNPFPATVSHDSHNDVVIRFTPTSAGPKSCTLVISSDDPDSPTVTKTVTANTPAASIDVPPNQSFLPEVIQSIGTCQSQKPFPISNTGKCNLNVTNVVIGGVNGGDYSLSGLPSFPIILQPGHIAGEGNLKTVFAPTALDRDRIGSLTVTYESDAITHATTNVSRDLCGEGVNTGARVLVRAGGVPLAKVEKIQLQRINANRNKNQVDTNDVAQNVPLQTVTPGGSCTPFQFHREYGTVSNPIQLLPGSYQVTVAAIVNGKKQSKTVAFDVTTCDFNPTIIVNF